MLVFSCVLQIVSYLFLVILTICCTSFRKLVFSINPYSGLSFPLNCLFYHACVFFGVSFFEIVYFALLFFWQFFSSYDGVSLGCYFN